MNHSTNERGTMPVLAAMLVVALIVVVGFAVYAASKANKKDAQTLNASPSPSESQVASASPTTTPTPSQSDNDLITQAVRSYNSQSANDTVTGITIVGANAKGNGATAGAASGYEFIAHKDNGTWKVVYRGQEKPGKALGTQYALPADWYSTAY
jgi:hypothetical protein